MKEVLPNEVNLIKSICIDYGERGLTVILYLVKYENHKSVFTSCFARRDTKEGWNTLLGGLEKMEPAERTRLDMLGINLPYIISSGGNYMTVFNTRRWLKNLLTKRPISPSYFSEYNSGCEAKYEEDYSGKGLMDIEEGLWYRKDRVKGPRKTRKIIY